jgi:hypothetical protein
VFEGLGWMGAWVALLAAIGVVGYVRALARCAEEEYRAGAARDRRALEDAQRVRESDHRESRAA